MVEKSEIKIVVRKINFFAPWLGKRTNKIHGWNDVHSWLKKFCPTVSGPSRNTKKKGMSTESAYNT